MVTDTQQRIGLRVRDRRLDLGLTQDQAAARCDDSPSRSTWQRLETVESMEDFRTFSRRALTGVAHVLGWAPDSWDRLCAGLDPIERPMPTNVHGSTAVVDAILRDQHLTENTREVLLTFYDSLVDLSDKTRGTWMQRAS